MIEYDSDMTKTDFFDNNKLATVYNSCLSRLAAFVAPLKKW